MILMDLKRVELAGYNGLPHLLVPVITEPERAKAALKWAVGEMENRYRRFAGRHRPQHQGFNETRVDPADRMPYIVIIIDELADLMMREGKNVEDPIVRLAQKARATGIHMVLATQRPSVNVVTGLIKANFPSRIAFAMASQIDCRTILDAPGAEDLIGRGDMLYQPADLPRPMRLQGVFVSDQEIGARHRALARPDRTTRATTSRSSTTTRSHGLGRGSAGRGRRPAAAGCRIGRSRSTIALPRRCSSGACKIGYARAARIIDQLEARGLRRGVRRFERAGGPPPGRRAGSPVMTRTMTMTTRDDARRRAARTGARRSTVAYAADGRPARAARSGCWRRASARASTSTGPSATRRSGPATSPPSSAATTASCRAPSTRRASCATTRCTSGWTPRRSSASGSASAATPDPG